MRLRPRVPSVMKMRTNNREGGYAYLNPLFFSLAQARKYRDWFDRLVKHLEGR
jgi:hypothetical protein